jgi:peptide deformylase
MSIRPILIHPDPRLKKVASPVVNPDDATEKLIAEMLETMYDAPGIGLAAPQVGVLSRVLVMDCAAKEAEPEPMALINPEITWSSEETNTHEEGCLSIPDIFEDVTRPKAVRVSFIDRAGVVREEEFDDPRATCVQHEIDHLNGKLFIDYLGAVKRSMITRKMQKLKRERVKA